MCITPEVLIAVSFFQSGLTEKCRNSKITMSAGEDQLLQFVTQHTEKGKARYNYYFFLNF